MKQKKTKKTIKSQKLKGSQVRQGKALPANGENISWNRVAADMRDGPKFDTMHFDCSSSEQTAQSHLNRLKPSCREKV